MDPGFRRTLDLSRAPAVIESPWSASTATVARDRLMDVDVNTYLPEDLLVKVDIASMAHSLEARSPLLDVELMEFAASLPASFKIRTGRKKWLLRKAYREVVPDEILDGPKRGFGVPLAAWFREELRDYSREILLDGATTSRGYFKRAAVESMLNAHQQRKADHSFRIWALLQLELWQRELGPEVVRG
jgi:asparagine synthase (glutamine-hydrolysing)